jgi:catechol 2,3-dioxygenase-like lactoylglutathione lyase family enzyme
MEPERATPLLRVADVARSATWYRDVLGFEVDAFPDHPPHVFAILKRGAAEIMLRRSPFGRSPQWEDWDVRIPLKNGLRELYARLLPLRVVTRRLERMPYCDAEFDIKDPDGYVICISQMLADADDIPQRTS